MTKTLSIKSVLKLFDLKIDLTTVLHGFIGPVLTVLHIVTHLAAVNALAIFTAELFRPVALCYCVEETASN